MLTNSKCSSEPRRPDTWRSDFFLLKNYRDGFQVVVVELLGFAFTKEGSDWTKVVFKVLGSSEKEEEWERREEGRKEGEKRKMGAAKFF